MINELSVQNDRCINEIIKNLYRFMKPKNLDTKFKDIILFLNFSLLFFHRCNFSIFFFIFHFILSPLHMYFNCKRRKKKQPYLYYT